MPQSRPAHGTAHRPARPPPLDNRSGRARQGVGWRVLYPPRPLLTWPPSAMSACLLPAGMAAVCLGPAGVHPRTPRRV